MYGGNRNDLGSSGRRPLQVLWCFYCFGNIRLRGGDLSKAFSPGEGGSTEHCMRRSRRMRFFIIWFFHLIHRKRSPFSRGEGFTFHCSSISVIFDFINIRMHIVNPLHIRTAEDVCPYRRDRDFLFWRHTVVRRRSFQSLLPWRACCKQTRPVAIAT